MKNHHKDQMPKSVDGNPKLMIEFLRRAGNGQAHKSQPTK